MSDPKFVGYSDGNQANPDGSEILYCEEIFELEEGEVASGYWLMREGLIDSPVRSNGESMVEKNKKED